MQLGQVGPQLIGEPGQDTVYFAALFVFQFPDGVISFQHVGGFYIDGLARGRFVVDEALKLTLMLGGYGDNHPAISNRERYVIPNPAAVFGGPQHAIESLAYIDLLRNKASPNLNQFGGGVVANLSTLVNDPVDSLGNGTLYADCFGVFTQQGIFIRLLVFEKTQALPDGSQRYFQVEKLILHQHGTFDGGALQVGSGIEVVLGRKLSARLDDVLHLGGLPYQFVNEGIVLGKAYFIHIGTTQRAYARFFEPFAQAVKT